jgi:hypothetical protein
VPFHIFAATGRDLYRKPMPGMWYELERTFAEAGVVIGKYHSLVTSWIMKSSPLAYKPCHRHGPVLLRRRCSRSKWRFCLDRPQVGPERWCQVLHSGGMLLSCERGSHTGWNSRLTKLHPAGILPRAATSTIYLTRLPRIFFAWLPFRCY